MSDQAKPAPTAAEIAEAQEMLNLYARIIDPPIAGQWVLTLLAALDAAEARAVPPGSFVVSDSPATIEKAGKALFLALHGDNQVKNWTGNRSDHHRTFRLLDAVLAALKEAAR